MQALHGADCGAPPAAHPVTLYEDAVFQCNDHVMTAINADGYGVVYLTPGQQVDFSAGEAVVRFDLSTLRTSTRDWVDLWVSPLEDHLQLPLQSGFPDLQGEPRRAVNLRMDTFTGPNTIFRPTVVRNFAAEEVPSNWWTGYETVLAPSATVRSTFELRLSRTHLKFGMPQYNLWWVDADIAPLDWSRGVVQLGHHSYTPAKDCALAGGCGPNTWHWDNVSIAPAVPFTMLKADRRVVDAASPAAVGFAAPAPTDAHLRFAGVGTGFQVSLDGGATWQAARVQPSATFKGDGIFKSYWTPIPAGTARVLLRGQDWPGGGPWTARDLAIWSPAPPSDGEGAQPERSAMSDVRW